MTILVADDAAKNRELLRTLLVHLGHTVVEAEDGVQAVALARESTPDLMIIDLQMPNLDGFGAIVEIRAMSQFRDTPVLALTAYAMPEDRDRVKKAGFTAYLTKPLRMSELRAQLTRWAVGG